MLFFLLKPPIVCSDYYIFLTKINQSNKFKHFLKIPCSAPFKVKALKMIKGKYPHTGRIEDGGLFSLICFCMHMYNITDNKLEHCETVTSITANDTDYIPQLFFFFFQFLHRPVYWITCSLFTFQKIHNLLHAIGKTPIKPYAKLKAVYINVITLVLSPELT